MEIVEILGEKRCIFFQYSYSSHKPLIALGYVKNKENGQEFNIYWHYFRGLPSARQLDDSHNQLMVKHYHVEKAFVKVLVSK